MKRNFMALVVWMSFGFAFAARGWQDTLPVLLVSQGPDGREVGRCGALPMEVSLSSNTTAMRVSISDNTSGGSGAAIRASVWNAAITAAMLRNNPMTGTRVTVDFDGLVDGPSAGGMICLGILSALDGRQVPDDFAMTGTILPDGTIGLVGGVRHKIRAAAATGRIKRVAIPAFQRFEVDPATGAYVDLFRLGEELGVVVRPVSSILEVYRFCHGLPVVKEEPYDERALCSLDRYAEKALIGEFQATDKKIRGHLLNLNSNDFARVRESYAWTYVDPIPSEALFEQGHLTEAFDRIKRCDAALKAYYTVEEEMAGWLKGFFTTNENLVAALRKDDSAALSNSLERLLVWSDGLCSELLAFTDDEGDGESPGPFTGFGVNLGPISPASAQMCSMMDAVDSEGLYLTRVANRASIADAVWYLENPENEATAFGVLDDFIRFCKIDLFCTIWNQVRDRDINERIMKAMAPCELRASGEEVSRLFYNAWRSVDQGFAQSLIEPLADRMAAHRDDAVGVAIGLDVFVARYERDKYWAEGFHALVGENRETIRDGGFSTAVDLFRQVETFANGSAMLLKYTDAGYDIDSDSYGNTAFLSYVIRNARAQALRSLAECKKAGIPCLAAIQAFEAADTARDDSGADRIHGILTNYWTANLRAKALLMACKPVRR